LICELKKESGDDEESRFRRKPFAKSSDVNVNTAGAWQELRIECWSLLLFVNLAGCENTKQGKDVLKLMILIEESETLVRVEPSNSKLRL
jgi:hypothetical protein